MNRLLTPPSPAERVLLLAYLCVAAGGAILGSHALVGLQGLVEVLGPNTARWVLGAASAAGACISAALLRERFGYKGRSGSMKALFGGIVATITLGIAAGTLVLPVFGTMFGPWLLLMTVFSEPLLALPWICSLVALHAAFTNYRAEQDTIFRHLERIDSL